MTPAAQHSPTPWVFTEEEVFAGEELIAACYEFGSYRPGNFISCANAAHIVLCVNSHDALVDALDRYVEQDNARASEFGETHLLESGLYRDARAALALAGGKP